MLVRLGFDEETDNRAIEDCASLKASRRMIIAK